MKIHPRLVSTSLALCFVFVTINAQQERVVWSKEKANAWYAKLPWMAGADFLPSTAINQLEMWQEESYDSATIDRELGFAAGIGMNVMRVYLHHLAWQAMPFRNSSSHYVNVFMRIEILPP